MGIQAINGGILELPLLTEFRVEAGCGEQLIVSSGERSVGGRSSLVSLPALESLTYLAQNFCTGFNIVAHKAGVSVIATMTDRIIAEMMVMENCR